MRFLPSTAPTPVGAVFQKAVSHDSLTHCPHRGFCCPEGCQDTSHGLRRWDLSLGFHLFHTHSPTIPGKDSPSP